MGLPGSGKTYLTERLVPIIGAAWFNADKVREMVNDWDFSAEGRVRQSNRMKNFADFEKSHGRVVVCDFVCPTKATSENSWIDWLSKYHENYLEWEKFSKEELQDALNKFVDKVLVRYDQEKNEHIVTIKFKLPLVKDKLKYKDPDDKGKGYSVKKGKKDLSSIGGLPQ